MSAAASTRAGPRWRVAVSSACLGSGLCVATAPESFRLVEGYARPRLVELEPNDRARAAAQLCPVAAITIYDARSGEPVDVDGD
ncbi:MAG: ferredoxin [Polyangiaceae bacterium]|nr:ferredoxin [Polyangiaceae bacterium]